MESGWIDPHCGGIYPYCEILTSLLLPWHVHCLHAMHSTVTSYRTKTNR